MAARPVRPTMPTHRAPNVFAGPYVDRSSGLRKDPAWLAAAISDGNSRFVPLWQQRNLLRLEPEPAAVLLSASALAPLGDTEVVLLGLFRGVACFAIEVQSEVPPAPGTEYADLHDPHLDGPHRRPHPQALPLVRGRARSGHQTPSR